MRRWLRFQLTRGERRLAATICVGAAAALCACGSEGDSHVSSADSADAAADATSNSPPPDPLRPIPHAAALAPPSLPGTDPPGSVDAGDATLTATDAEAGADVSVAHPVPSGPPFCGNGQLDPGEECDPGNAYAPPACSYFCQAHDFIPAIAAKPLDAGAPSTRRLGHGRHPIAASADGQFAIASLERAQGALRVVVSRYTAGGAPIGTVLPLAMGGNAVDEADPVLTSLSPGTYAVAWSDLNGDGDELGVGIRLVNAQGASSAAFANATTASNQYAPDVLYSGNRIVVAWTDESDPTTAPDLRIRTFDSTLAPTSIEMTLAASADAEGDVALTTFGSGYAAAWRSSSGDAETVHVRTESGGEWTFALAAAGPAGNRPALASVDSTHLAVVYAEGTAASNGGAGGGSRLKAAVIDTTSTGPAVPFDIPSVGANADQDEPTIARLDGAILMGWRELAATGDANGDEVFAKSVAIGAAGALDWSASAVPLQRWSEHRRGDQRIPALAAAGAAGVAAWEDYAGTIGAAEWDADIVVSAVTPALLRTGDVADADQLQRYVARDKDVYCRHLADCCQIPVEQSDQAKCKAGPVPQLFGVTSALPYFDAGTIRLSKAAADQCLRESTQIDCARLTGDVYQHWQGSCVDALQGAIALGQSGCRDSFECAGEAYCDKATGATTGTCAARKALGTTCGATRECAHRGVTGGTEYCAAGACAATKDVGGTCAAAAECAGGFCGYATPNHCATSAPMTDQGVAGGFCARFRIVDAGGGG
jgi:cysteine-rich repeat protein